jgi:hypothetical protein
VHWLRSQSCERESQSCPCEHFVRGTPESHDEDAHAPIHAADQWLLEKGGQSSALGCPALHILQLLPDSSDFESDTSNGSRINDHVWGIEDLCALMPKPAVRASEIEKNVLLKALQNKSLTA